MRDSYRIATLLLALGIFARLSSPARAALVSAQMQANEGGTWLPLTIGTAAFGETDRYVWQTLPGLVAANDFKFFQINPAAGWPSVDYGLITFTITQSGPAYIAVTTRFGGGGNSGGGWIPQLTSEAQLEAQGWNQIAGPTEMAIDDPIGSSDLQLILFERDVLAGETFTYRTEKYIPPILLETAAVPEPSTCVLAVAAFAGFVACAWRQRKR